MPLLDELNPAQREAARTVHGPVLVLAGAGSGKTRVLTYRIAHLLQEHDVRPWAVLAVTFTNKAAGEMRERVARLVGPTSERMWVGTFHSMCARLLRLEAVSFGLDPRFTIYDEDDRRALARRVLQAHQIDERDLAPRGLVSLISRAKNAMVDPAAVVGEDESAGPGVKRLAQLAAAYEAELRQNNALDFDDLLVHLVRRFDACPEVLARYQERFAYLLVDEYQDTNRPQYLLCRQLAGTRRNLCCVGDDDQSIYQFRGADIRNILDFEQDYPDAHVIRLEQNYRSTGCILAAANGVIQHNRSRKGKQLWTEASRGAPIEVVMCASDRDEARFVVSAFRDLIRQHGYRHGDLAVLYRTNAQSRALEEELQRSGMPYQIVGGTRFYERREVKDLLAYLRLLANPADSVSLRRVLNVPRRGLGDTSVERLAEHARQLGVGMLEACGRLEEVPEITARARRGLEDFAAMVVRLAAVRDTESLADLGRGVYDQSGYCQMLAAEGTPESEARAQNVEQLISFMGEFADTEENPTLDSFLERVALMTPSDETTQSGQSITLMTVHSAKGLEFPVVFICGMEENLFPTSRAVEEGRRDPQAIEEERRLCYVGITRARERLYLTAAERRYAYGAMVDAVPSRFLAEIPDDLVHTQSAGDIRPARPGSPGPGRVGTTARGAPPVRPSGPRGGSPGKVSTAVDAAGGGSQTAGAAASGPRYVWDEPQQRADLPECAADVDAEDFLAVGRFVRHATWGRGEVMAREGAGQGLRVSIRFAGTGVKKVAVAYARLEPA